MMLFGGSQFGNFLYELSGRGCDTFDTPHERFFALSYLGPHLTRLDIAIDIECDVSPIEFADARTHNRFRSKWTIESDEGQSVYVGSPKSDRYAVVYRYEEPHPRSHLLRIEHRFRRELAKETAAAYCDEHADEFGFVTSVGLSWGWEHEAWAYRDAEAEPLSPKARHEARERKPQSDGLLHKSDQQSEDYWTPEPLPF